jgi:hypothetical protein
MLTWWTNLESVSALNNVLLFATLFFAALSGLLVFITVNRSRQHAARLNDELLVARKQIKTLTKTAETIRRELLQTQQHQDISQLKLKTSKSSSEELRHALLDARKRLKAAEEAINAHQAPPPEAHLNEAHDGSSNDADDHAIETVDLELEVDPGLSGNQCDQLVDLLDPGPKGNIDIYCVMGDENSERTAQQIEGIMTADGWKTNGVAQSAFTTPPSGLLLVVNSKQTAPSYASFLQRVFTTIGLPVTAKIDKKYREWSLSVIVGTFDA